MSTTLTLSGLVVSFGARTLVDGLDLVVADGDVTALVGPNGSGKSSLMRAVVGELPVESGSVRLAPARRHDRLAPPGHARPRRDPAGLRPPADRRRRGRRGSCTRRRRRSPPGCRGPTRGTPTRWSAGWRLGAADLEDRLPAVAGEVGLDVAPDRAARLAVGRAGGARHARRRAAQQVRRAAARRADQRPRRARPGADGRLRDRTRRAGARRQPRPGVPRPRGHACRRARPAAAADRALHRQLHGVRRSARARRDGRRSRRSRSTPARGTASRRRPGSARAGRSEGAATWRRGWSRTSTSARSSRRARTGRTRRRRG